MKNDRNNKGPVIPSGEFTTKAMLVTNDKGDNGKLDGTLFENIGGPEFLGDYRVSVIAKDPYTGNIIRLDNIKVNVSMSQNMAGLKTDQELVLKCTSYSDFKKSKTETMTVEPGPEKPIVQNKAIPQPVKVKDSLNSFATNPSALCKKFEKNQDLAHRHLGLTHDRDDITVFQGKENGKSPGVLVHQQDGSMYMFDSSGKQYMAMDGQRIKMNATGVDFGSADIERTTMQYGGLPQKENPVNDFVPQGTILTPQPKTIPHVAMITNTLLTIYDMIDLVKTCTKAVKLIRDGKSGEEALSDIQKDNPIEKAWYGDEYDQHKKDQINKG